jgi:hypothetical protein
MPRHFDPVAIRAAWEAEKAEAKQVIEEEDEDNYAASLDAYPDLTKETFNLFGGRDLSQMSADQINVNAGSVAGQQFGAQTIREPRNRPDDAYTKEGGWEASDDPHVPVYTPDPTPALIGTEERTTTTPTVTPPATTTSTPAATVMPSLKGDPDTSFQFNPQRSLLDPSMIAGGEERVFKLHFIYPEQKSDEEAGKIYPGPNDGNYAWSGDWKLSTKEMELLEERLRRSLGESSVKIEPGMEVHNTKASVDDIRSNWDAASTDLDISSLQYEDRIVPVYIIRGLGAFAGSNSTSGTGKGEFSGSWVTLGDGIIEALAGRKGKTAYELIQNFEDKDGDFDDHAFMSSYLAQMGTVLHESLHAVAALPHREGGTLSRYVEDIGGAHGEEFAKVLDDSMRGKAGTDKFAALNLIMNEPWSYGWGQEGQDIPQQMSGGTTTTIPSSTQGPLVEIEGREKAPSLLTGREGVLHDRYLDMDKTTPQPGIIETMSRSTSSSGIETPNSDIVTDMYEATRHVGTFRTGRTGRTGPQRNILGQVGNNMSVMPGMQDGLGLTEGPLIETIPRLRGQ